MCWIPWKWSYDGCPVCGNGAGNEAQVLCKKVLLAMGPMLQLPRRSPDLSIFGHLDRPRTSHMTQVLSPLHLTVLSAAVFLSIAFSYKH